MNRVLTTRHFNLTRYKDTHFNMTNSLIANDQKLENDHGTMSITRKLTRQKQKIYIYIYTEKDNVIIGLLYWLLYGLLC